VHRAARENVLDWRLVGRVAQVVEQRPFKAWVAGSNPAALTMTFLEQPLKSEVQLLATSNWKLTGRSFHPRIKYIRGNDEGLLPGTSF
jgi:hypothetical protein